MSSHRQILLFDGVCNLCNGIVQFILPRDRQGKFRFASLQSEAGQALLREFDLPTHDFDSFVYIEGDRCYTKSTAALRVLRELGGHWRLLYVFTWGPRPLRDWVYSAIAKSRYRIFGKRESCMVPEPGVQERFLG